MRKIHLGKYPRHFVPAMELVDVLKQLMEIQEKVLIEAPSGPMFSDGAWQIYFVRKTRNADGSPQLLYAGFIDWSNSEIVLAKSPLFPDGKKIKVRSKAEYPIIFKESTISGGKDVNKR